jgi:hypothetical protein
MLQITRMRTNDVTQVLTSINAMTYKNKIFFPMIQVQVLLPLILTERKLFYILDLIYLTHGFNLAHITHAIDV